MGMLKFKALYKAMYDDLKDSDMLIDYAHELKEIDSSIAKELASYAQERFSHFKKFHDIFVSEVKEWSKGKETESKEMVEDCLWAQAHEHFQDWAEKIQSKIKAF